MAKKEYDVLIIGSGASGGMAAYTLTQKGIKCLMLDAGPPVDFARQSVRATPIRPMTATEIHGATVPLILPPTARARAPKSST